jgi:hypothetical protein
MRNSSFSDFMSKKKRDELENLKILERILQSKGMKTQNFLENQDDPYIFCYNPSDNCSFDGVRIYTIADTIAFRVQKESETHPYGRAYPLKIEEMFEDFLSDDGINKKEAATKVMDEVANAVKKFFDKSATIEKDVRFGLIDEPDNLAVRGTSNDYSNLIYNKAT